MMDEKPGFYEFFAGGGMARMGLGNHWKCLFANDCCAKKTQAYRGNFPPAHELHCGDVAMLTLDDLPGCPQLAWASFPCQDLSLAGVRQGLNGKRSGNFWPFWQLMLAMQKDGREIPLIVLENVSGAITSHNGADFRAIVQTIMDAGYKIGAMVVDAVHFVPQSRPRLFLVAIKDDWEIPEGLLRQEPHPWCHSSALVDAAYSLPDNMNDSWLWWNLPEPPKRNIKLENIIDENPKGVDWHTPSETARLIRMMSDINLQKLKAAKLSKRQMVGAIYKRTRSDENGERVQRAEVRFDGLSGCLRTPVGGSSRQIILTVEGNITRSRLLSPRECARLMGVPESYRLPGNYNEAYHLMGDGLAVPVVSWIESHLVYPLFCANHCLKEIA